MPTPDELTALRRNRDQSMAAAIALDRRAAETEDALRVARRIHGERPNEEVRDLEAKLASIRTDAAGARRAHDGLRKEAIIGLREWLRQTPDDVVARLPDQDPFLLFPVRLETRFARTANGAAELRVRIWPDDIGVAIPPGDLSDKERDAGEQYWNARATAATTLAREMPRMPRAGFMRVRGQASPPNTARIEPAGLSRRRSRRTGTT